MARVKLTAGRIRDFGATKGQAFLWDEEVPGLAVRATAPSKANPAGLRAFIFQGKLPSGEDVRVTVGDARAWGIDQARAEARRLRTLIDQGTDPREQKRERIAAGEAKKEARREEARRNGVIVGDAWNEYIAARSPAWGARHLANHEALTKAGGEPRKRGRRPGESDKTMPGPLAPLLAMRLAELDTDAVQAWLAKESAKAPTQAAQAFRALKAFMRWCAEQKELVAIVPHRVCEADKVRRMVPRSKPKADALQREQLPGWFAAVRVIGNPVIAAYLQALLLTGSRREELLSLQWEDVDFRWQAMTIHDKVEGERTIPLTPYVAGLLASLPRRNEWVFNSPAAASGRLMEPGIRHRRACAVAGISGLSLHGLRRSFKSLSEWVEMPVGIVAQIMGHKPSATAEKHYTVRPLDLLRMWHSRYEAWLLEQAGTPQPEEAAEGLRLVKLKVTQ